mmetsp:Transcript_9804/g.59680  ORF Transcript_9804/g.59680 Transcript_9804/m.59680 type:complete len:356 (+) Transcript_9804:959-2026(+)
MLLCYTHIKGTLRKSLLEDIHSSTTTHCSMNSNHPVVSLCLGNQTLCKELGIACHFGLSLNLLSSLDIILHDTMHLIRRILSRVVPTPLLCADVNQHRSNAFSVLHLSQDGHQVVEVVTVHCPNVVHSKLFKECGATPTNHAARIFIHLCSELLDGLGKLLADSLGYLSKLSQGSVRLEAGEHTGHRTNRILVLPIVLSRQGNLIVIIQDDNHVLVQESGIVECLVRHSSSDCPVSDHSNDFVVLVFEVPTHCHAKPSTNAGAAVSSTERIILRLGTLGEPGQSMGLTDGGHTIPPAGQDLVWVSLVAYIPNDPVFWGVENVVQGHGQFHHAQRRTQMTTRFGHGLDDISSNLPC